MDRFVAMLILLGVLVTLILMILALFAVAPVICSCLLSLVYTVYLFMAYEESGVHHAQEFENRFWTIFALLFSTALFFARDSPFAFGRGSPSFGFVGVMMSSYAMHLWDRHTHRLALSRQTNLRRSYSFAHGSNDHNVPAEKLLLNIEESLRDIDQKLIPSTINNFINERFVLRKERDIINVFLECDAVALNHLVNHVRLGLLIYKIKDHRNFSGQHRTQLIQILAVDRLPALTVISRVIVLHALQMLKLRANPRAEYWVRNIILNSHGDDLSDMKTLTDAKGDYFCMNKLIFDDIKSETVRQDILNHIRKEAAVQQAHVQMMTKRAQKRQHMAWRKVLSDVDDTLLSSGGAYPAGIDKRYARKVVYPGVLAFYRELDLGTRGPEEWPEHSVGNLVFLSARPHVYKDMSEKSNFAKFEKLRVAKDGRVGMHTTPSLLAGDIVSGSHFIATNDCEPLSLKKFSNFERYVSIYPEYRHVFVCDNGQGDVRAGEMMFDAFPYEFEALYIHIVQGISKTYGFAPERWRQKEFKPVFFRTYPEAALHAARCDPPRIRISGLRRVCTDAVGDFTTIQPKQWASKKQKAERRQELNQAIWEVSQFLISQQLPPVDLIPADREWQSGEWVNTPYGRGIVKDFDPTFEMYSVELDWRPLDVQVAAHLQRVKEEAVRPRVTANKEKQPSTSLETVIESEEAGDDEIDETLNKLCVIDDGLGIIDGISVKMVTDTTGSGYPVAAENLQTKAPEKSNQTETKTEDSPSDDKVALKLATATALSPESSSVFKSTLRVHGQFVSRYTPPKLPTISKKKAIFSFWTADGGQAQIEVKFKIGDKCSTPYGPGTVAQYRKRDRMVVVDMIGWTAQAFLNENDVQTTSQGIFSSIFRRQASTASDSGQKQQQPSFPYAQGTILQTPYGEACVVRPLPSLSKAEKSKIAVPVHGLTLGLKLTSWTLKNEAHPMLYCTVEQAQKWKDAKERGEKSPDGLLSAFGSLVTTTLDFANILGSSQKNLTKKEEAPKPKFKQYYKNAAAVSTSYGDGVVKCFRENDGIYEVHLIGWKLAGKSCAIAYIQQNDVNHRIARGCQEGYPVSTYMGLTGILESVEPTTGCHLVTCKSAGMVMYLQPEAVLCPLKAAVGEDVLTAYGDGVVEYYCSKNSMYTIKLNGWGAKLYARAETFDRVGDSMRDREGSFGMNWLVRFFFSSSEKPGETTTRSRSNSVVSGVSASVRSQSGRSVS